MKLRYRWFAVILALVAALVVSPPEVIAQKKGKAKTSQTSKSGKSQGKSQNKSQGKSQGASKGKASGKGKGGKAKPAKPETSADVKKRQEATAREIKQTEQQIKENEAAVKKNLVQLGKLQGDISVSRNKLAAVNAKVATLEAEISRLETQIADEEKQLETLRTEYLKAVKTLQTKRKEQSTLAFIFSSKNFNEALRRMRYLREFSAWRKSQTADINRRVAALKEESTRLQQTQQMHSNELAIQRKEYNTLQTQYARQDAIVVNLKKNGQALKSHLAKKQAEANQLKQRIATLIAEEQRKAEAERIAREKQEAERLAKLEAERKAKEEAGNKNDSKKSDKDVSYADARKRRPKTNSESATTGKSSASSSSTASSSASSATASAADGFESMRGSLPRPVSGSFKVTSRFGRQSLPDLPGVEYDNPGIDAEVASGASALAVYVGKVSGVYMIPGYSTVVIVNHGNYFTVYGNLASTSVKVGDSVKQGQAVGKVAPDEDDPSHSSIHFEVWKNRDKLNPLNWIK